MTVEIIISRDAEELGKRAAEQVAEALNEAIESQGGARLLLSTGASQLTTLSELVKKDVDWSKVELFHLDEYVGLSESHPASFRKYIKERFLSHVDVKKAHLVDGEGDIEENTRKLTEEIRKAPIDVALIGIGENAHIAFNDPPADFDTKEDFIVVKLDESCKMQQVGEGWFKDVDEVPAKAITMTVHRIMQSKKIISCVPYKVKAKAVRDSLEREVTNLIPATILKLHDDWTLYLDEESASLLDDKYRAQALFESI